MKIWIIIKNALTQWAQKLWKSAVEGWKKLLDNKEKIILFIIMLCLCMIISLVFAFKQLVKLAQAAQAAQITQVAQVAKEHAGQPVPTLGSLFASNFLIILFSSFLVWAIFLIPLYRAYQRLVISGDIHRKTQKLRNKYVVSIRSGVGANEICKELATITENNKAEGELITKCLFSYGFPVKAIKEKAEKDNLTEIIEFCRNDIYYHPIKQLIFLAVSPIIALTIYLNSNEILKTLKDLTLTNFWKAHAPGFAIIFLLFAKLSMDQFLKLIKKIG